MQKLLVAATCLFFSAVAQPAMAQLKLEQKEQLLEKVIAAHDAADFEAIAELIEWRGISGYKKKMVKVYTRSTFGRAIKNASFEVADTEYLRRFELGPKTYASNMDVVYLMRLEFDEEVPAGEDAPSVVFLVGKDEQGYKIAMTAPIETSK